jgi:mannose-6-phosphate isomerase-like protein (cupin superfamily)
MSGQGPRSKLRGMPPAAPQITVEVVTSAAQTAGAYSLMDVRVDGGMALDPHVARHEDLLLYILAGDLVVVLDGRRHALTAGDHLAVPRRVPRAVHVPGRVRLLCLARPGGSERLALRAADPSVTRDDRAALLAAADVRLLPLSLWGPRPG